MAQLLDGIAREGSIRKAAAAMKMRYRKAWLLIQNMQETFGGAALTKMRAYCSLATLKMCGSPCTRRSMLPRAPRVRIAV